MRYGFGVQTIIDLYGDEEKDPHMSEWRTRLMFKWNTHHSRAGTPWAVVNGVLLEVFPAMAQDWMDMLNSVYAEQYKPKKEL